MTQNDPIPKPDVTNQSNTIIYHKLPTIISTFADENDSLANTDTVNIRQANIQQKKCDEKIQEYYGDCCVIL